MPIDEILAALESSETSGSFCTNKNVNSTNFDIKFNKIGALAFPIQETQIQALISIAQPAKFGWKDQTILDKEVRNVWEISKSKVKIGKKQWEAKIEPLLEKFKTDLGLPKKSKLTADLHNMLIYQPGHFFKPHQDTEKIDGMVATLVIILPTAHEGGELIIDHLGVKKTFKHASSALNKLSCIAFYADCYHEVKEVTSGYRVSLTYNLILEKYKGNVDVLFDPDFESKLEKSLVNHFSSDIHREPRGYKDTKPLKVIYLLEHQYTQQSLSWDGLKNNDQVRVNALLKLADQLDFTAHLALADMKETWDCEFDYNEYRYNRKRGYHDDEEEEEGTPTYIMDSSTELKHWINRQGKPVELEAFTPCDSEICWTGANENLEPYQSEYEGWQGNYGNTLDRWYHRAAIVLWRKDDYYPILFEIDQDSFIKEIFLLVQTKESLSKLRDMLRHASPYWERYVRKHKGEPDIINAIELTLYLNDSDIGLNLLGTYELSIFNAGNIELWFKLINNYGHQWIITLLANITNKEEKKNPHVIAEYSKLIQILLDGDINRELIDWLINYQLTALKTTHKSPYNIGVSSKFDEMTDFISGLSYARDNKTHLDVITYLMENRELYPALPLVKLFETGISQLKQPDLEECGYPVLLHYLADAITIEHQLGLRDKHDWSIKVESQCNCSNCTLLNQFLNQSDVIQKIWPLTESSRAHIARELMKLSIPVDCKEERTGRPYKLILTKTEELYTAAENRYKAIERALVLLHSTPLFL